MKQRKDTTTEDLKKRHINYYQTKMADVKRKSKPKTNSLKK